MNGGYIQMMRKLKHNFVDHTLRPVLPGLPSASAKRRLGGNTHAMRVLARVTSRQCEDVASVFKSRAKLNTELKLKPPCGDVDGSWQ